MKKYGIVVFIIGMLVLTAALNRTAWADTAITQLNGLAAAAGLNRSEQAPSPGTVVTAGEPVVNITSFVMTDQTSRLAEICGKVTGSDADFTVVRIVVDPKSNTPGTYNTLAAVDGAFCSVVVTYTRTASASVKVLGKASASMVATASGGTAR